MTLLQHPVFREQSKRDAKPSPEQGAEDMTIYVTTSYTDVLVDEAPQVNVYDTQSDALKHATEWENVLGHVDIQEFSQRQACGISWWERPLPTVNDMDRMDGPWDGCMACLEPERYDDHMHGPDF